MPARLVEYFRHVRKLNDDAGPATIERDAGNHLGTVLALLGSRTGHDFRGYKGKTVLRRIQRRMQVLQIDRWADFVERLRQEPRQVELLFQDLLIGVTNFFRDTEAFEALERQVIPRLFEGKGADSTVRVWVPGCSTGEEAYSIAILLRDHLPKANGAPKLQVFATDIDERALETAPHRTLSDNHR